MTDEEAGMRVLALMQMDIRKLHDVDELQMGFKAADQADDDFAKALTYASKQGWIEKKGSVIKLASAGLAETSL